MKDKTPTPTLEQKVEEYERFLHNINLMIVCHKYKAIQQLVDNADSWSYSHRVGNGELTEEQQQELINRAFWNLNNIHLD
jgi:hypothetical protein